MSATSISNPATTSKFIPSNPTDGWAMFLALNNLYNDCMLLCEGKARDGLAGMKLGQFPIDSIEKLPELPPLAQKDVPLILPVPGDDMPEKESEFSPSLREEILASKPQVVVLQSPVAQKASESSGKSVEVQRGMFNIGIVGAGVSGLFTAMVLDHINEELAKDKKPKLFEYTILEANSQDRVGGRLFTYQFGKNEDLHYNPNDYFDVGAMRFPKSSIMTRVFDLFHRLGMRDVPEEEFEAAAGNVAFGSIIPYYINNHGREPFRYNDKTLWANNLKQLHTDAEDGDPFQMELGKDIPLNILRHSPFTVFETAIKPIASAVKDDIENGRTRGWELLMRCDKFSTREFLSLSRPQFRASFSELGVDYVDGDVPLPPFNSPTIKWMEIFNSGTNSYDQAFSESVLGYLHFNYEENMKWSCIYGGSQHLAKRMCMEIEHTPEYKCQVTAIRQTGIMQVEVDMKTCLGKETEVFNAVFNTTTLGCLRRMDLTEAKLGYGAKHAIRSLGYGQSTKIGIRFKNAWWIHGLQEFGIRRGGQGHTDMHIRTCVYPSYNIHDDAEKTAVLLVSYTWQQDSQRLSCLVHNRTPCNEGRVHEDGLKELLLKELALLHSDSPQAADELLRIITESYVDHFSFDWDNEPTTAGAFAFFKPQQFSGLWAKIVQPSGDVVIIGEAASPHHAWVVGALESAINGIYLWLAKNADKELFPELQDAMKIIERATPSNPFQGLPHYTKIMLAQWQARLALLFELQMTSNRTIIDTSVQLQPLMEFFKGLIPS